MAQKFLVNIDMGGNQLLNVVVQVLSTAPNNPAAGRMYFDSTIGLAASIAKVSPTAGL